MRGIVLSAIIIFSCETARAQFICDLFDPNSDLVRAGELTNLSFSYWQNAAGSNDPVEKCDDMTSAVDALKEAYEIYSVCNRQLAVSTMGLIRSYNGSRSDYCAEAEADEDPDDEADE
ncbi:MAG: hypothetical protein E5X35_31315 [Mesorhizobium sp.]|uniref:hypothetical protein n=1 Tax=Mesorhizobium sp. TaxID=1871066 RepID=UPI0011FB25A0|nr:hypothetical protein [Mesorhizobium sp.]TIR28277.1 MAG: hypothetical protein E5X35_31315 [Mesorhizobium sp.]